VDIKSSSLAVRRGTIPTILCVACVDGTKLHIELSVVERNIEHRIAYLSVAASDK